MPAFNPETARAANAAKQAKRKALDSGDSLQQMELVDELHRLRPQAVSILKAGLKSRDAKIRHESSQRVLLWLEKLDPTSVDAPTKVVYMTAALPHDLFTQDPDDIPSFVPGA